jgi:AraC-like DNA-binding protein
MTSAALLRKTLLAILQEKILPDLRSPSTPRFVTAHLPLKMPAGFTVREMPYPPLREADAQRIYPEGKKWDKVHLWAVNYPALHCIVEGEADMLTGLTVGMLNQAPPADRPTSPRGGYLISAAAPAYILIPPGVPQRTGAVTPWQREQPHTGMMRIFQVRVLPIGALCHFSTMEDDVFHVHYSLLIKDNQLAAIMGVLLDEQSTTQPSSYITHAQLLSLMLRLERSLSTQRPLMTNGLYSRFPDSNPVDLEAQPLHHPTIERAHEYIQLHLHEPLNPSLLAEHVHLTPTQLNRILRAHTGESTMGYVNRLRIETARLLLRTSELSIQEICRLVGYRRQQHFSALFRRHTGSSPSRFRQQGEAGNTS